MNKIAMKMAKASNEEWEKVMRFTNELDDMVNGNFKHHTDEEIGSFARKNMPPMLRVVFGYRVLVDNCCNPNSDTLEFNDKLSALLSGAQPSSVPADAGNPSPEVGTGGDSSPIGRGVGYVAPFNED